MKHFLIIVIFILGQCSSSFSQNTDDYKFVYSITLHPPSRPNNTDSLDSLPIQLVKTRFEINSKRRLSNKEITTIKECLLNHKGTIDLCDKKGEYYILGIL